MEKRSSDASAAGAPRPLPQSLGEWLDLLRGVGKEVLSDHATMTAGALAFYSLLAIVPVLVAVSALYGLVADPQTVHRSLEALRGFLPDQAVDLLANTLNGHGVGLGLGIGLFVSIVIVLWTAQWAASGLITALNIVFDTTEERSFLGRQIASLVLALAGILFLAASLLIVALLPALRSVFVPKMPHLLLLSLRWPLLAFILVGGLSTLYCRAPCRSRDHCRWLNGGAFLATLLWIGVSFAFTEYLRHAGSYNRIYGSLGGVAIFVTWLYLSGLIVLLGAEFEAALEARRTGRGERRAKRILHQHESSAEPGTEPASD
jgi:membrane protein